MNASRDMRDTHEAAFLRTIAENPDDLVGRVVLADYLDERGDGARAEFLRVQCELATPGVSDERRQTLRHRERALLEAHRREWLNAIGLPGVPCFSLG